MSFDLDQSALYTCTSTGVFHVVALRAEFRAFTLLLDTRNEIDFCSTETHVKFTKLVIRVQNFVSKLQQWFW